MVRALYRLGLLRVKMGVGVEMIWNGICGAWVVG